MIEYPHTPITPPTIIAILTAFNRCASTLDALASLEISCRNAGVMSQAVLMDDGSTDGTAQAVRESYPWATVLEGDGNLFWNRGMHAAQAHAMTLPHDYLLWLNDDTRLEPNAITKLIATSAHLTKTHSTPCIVVGATSDPATGRTTYGGDIAPSRWRPFYYRRLTPGAVPIECHAMNGNIVLIPTGIVRIVGNLDPLFEHAMGDTDYALRARRAGFRIYIAPGHLGECSGNQVNGTYRDPVAPLSERWRKILSRKGLPFRSWLHFTRRHGGMLWPLYFAWPYLRLLIMQNKSKP